MTGELWLEQKCEHGELDVVGGHWVKGDKYGTERHCPGGSRRRVTIKRLQYVLDTTIDNLLPDGQGMAIDVEALLDWAVEE